MKSRRERRQRTSTIIVKIGRVRELASFISTSLGIKHIFVGFFDLMIYITMLPGFVYIGILGVEMTPCLVALGLLQGAVGLLKV